MLKLVVASAAEIPEGLSSLYEEKGGQFHLKLAEPVVPKSQVDEFRNNNIELMKKQTELATALDKYKGVDLDKYQEALKAQQLLDDKKLLDAGKIDELVEQRTQRMRSDFEGQTKALNTKIEELSNGNTNLNSKLSSVLIDASIQAAINEIGRPREGAVQDILNRGRSLFRLIDGVPTPVGPDNNAVFGKDGKAPMTFKEWAQGLMETAPFLFESASGGGAQGNRQHQHQAPVKIIPAGDPVTFGQNLEAIAAGKVTVSQ